MVVVCCVNAMKGSGVVGVRCRISSTRCGAEIGRTIGSHYCFVLHSHLLTNKKSFLPSVGLCSVQGCYSLIIMV